MSVYDDVWRCFSQAFKKTHGGVPVPNKNLSTDYSLPPDEVYRILYLTSQCLHAKGWSFDPLSVGDKCDTATVAAAVALIAENTTKAKAAKKKPAKKKPGGAKKKTTARKLTKKESRNR